VTEPPAPARPVPDDEVQQLRNEVEALRGQLAQQQAILDRLIAVSPTPPSTIAEATHQAERRATVADRRSLLKHVGVAAVGAVGLGAVETLQATPAAAATGDPVLVGQQTSGSGTTTIYDPDDFTGNGVFTAYVGELVEFIGDSGKAAAVLGSAFGVPTTANPTLTYGVAGITSQAGAGGYFQSMDAPPGESLAVHLLAMDTHIYFNNGAAAESPFVSGARTAGQMLFDANSELWICVESGNPGVWRRLASPNAVGFATILPAPARIYDSRPGAIPLAVTKAPLTGGEVRGISALVGQHVPLTATAIMCNLTVTATSNGGWLAVYPGNTDFPGTSTLNWFASESTVANMTVVGLDSGGDISLMCSAGSTCDVVIDVLAYY
jgi:hypothetical protein